MSDRTKEGSPNIPANLIHRVHERVSNGRDSFVGEVKVEPYEQQHTSLGFFTRRSQLKGFAVELKPDPDPENSVVTQVTPLGSAQRYELVLHVANYGNKTITANIWQV